MRKIIFSGLFLLISCNVYADNSAFTSTTGAPTDATYITQTSNTTLSAEQALSGLSSGIMRVATTTGVITSLTDSSGIAVNISDETGSGALTFGTSPTLATPIETGKIDRNNVAVDDDDCTGEQGLYWYDTTDSKFEFCDANSGVPGNLSGVPGGSDTQVQFNNAGVFGGATGITYITGTGLTTFTQQATGTRAVIFKGKASTTVPIIDVQNSDGTSVFAVEARSATVCTDCTFAGSESGIGGVSNATAADTFYGYKAGRNVTSGLDLTYVGHNAGSGVTTATNTTVVGGESGMANMSGGSCLGEACLGSTTGADNSCVGKGCLGSVSSGQANSCVGGNCGISIATGNSNSLLGIGADVSGAAISDSIALGRASIVTANNQLNIGSSGFPISDVYIGNAVTNASPAGFTLNATGGSGTNIAGADLVFASGKGTGNAAGGNILIKTSDAGASGTALQSLTTKFTIAASGTFIAAGNDLGWTVVDQTDNQACTTGCTSACVFGIANATGTAVTNIVSCSDTTADLCLCAGSS